MRLHTPRVTGSLEVSSSALTITSVGTYSGSSTATGSFGRVAASTVEGTLATAGQTNITSVGTIGTGVWNSTFGSTANTLISGSFTSLSSSLASRITAEEAEAEGSVISSSAQIASDISGSFTTVSSSLASKVTTLEGTGTAQGVGTTNSPTFADVTATGTVTAQEFHTEFISASVLYGSGSTRFGDTTDDTHAFTGSLTTSGSSLTITSAGTYSGSSTSTGSFGRTEANSIQGTLVTAGQTNVTSVGTIGTGVWNSTFGSTANTLISGSANAANISGSLGTNATLIRSLTAANISGSLGTNASLIRSLTAAIISGSFTSLSSSLASRISAEEGEAEGSVISSSAQIASDISGSFTSASSSLASRITTNESYVKGKEILSGSAQIAANISGSADNKATPGFAIAMSVAL
jgi:hypothetical protein